MTIYYLDGGRLKKGVVAAAQRILDVQERINRINVFPVPDGDTGTNMALTMKSVADGAINAQSVDIDGMSTTLAEAALMGARGNSGAILAQFFQGLAESFANKNRVSTTEFAHSADQAVRFAETAVANPTEGTILTVMRDWAESLKKLASSYRDFRKMLPEARTAASESLERTPEQLAVLTKAGVVDAGAAGFVNMLEGINTYMETGELEEWTAVAEAETADAAAISQEEITFRYCTECLVEGPVLNRNDIKAAIAEMGDSMIVAGSNTKVRIHIHTDDPQHLFKTAARFGTVSKEKYDDMQHQHDTHANTKAIALLTDSSCDLPNEWLIEHGVRVVPVNLLFGTRTVLDRVEITSREVYRLLRSGEELPTSSQPSPAQFKKAYAMAAEQHKEGIGIFVSSKLSGTWQAAKQSAEAQDKIKMSVVDSRNIAGSVGLLVRLAAESISEGCDLDEITRRVELAREHTKIFVALDSVDNMVRSGRLPFLAGKLSRWLKLVPIIGLNKQGAAKPCGKGRPGKDCWDKVLKLCADHLKDLENPRFLICHADNLEAARYYEERLKAEHAVDHVDILEVSPTIGVHAGLGAAAVTVMGFPKGGAT